MFLSDPPASDLAETLYDEHRESDGCLQPDAQRAGAAPAAVRAAVGYGRAPAESPSA